MSWLNKNYKNYKNYNLVGNRIPKDYFIAKGKGESNICIYSCPNSFHLALKDAGIEMCNIISYSSVLPAIATEIEKSNLPKLAHGSVMETVMAIANAKNRKRATAGLTYGWLYDKATGKKHGGIICKYEGHLNEEMAKKKLKESLDELYKESFSDKHELRNTSIITETFVPKKKYGTALVALCFVDYVYPIKK